VTAVTIGPGLPGIQTLRVENGTSALSVLVSIVEIVDRAGAARFSEVVGIDLPETVAADAVVDSRAPRRLVIGDADHIGLIVAREVLVDEPAHGRTGHLAAANTVCGVERDSGIINRLRSLLCRWLATLREQVGHVEHLHILRSTIELVEVILVKLLVGFDFALEDHGVGGGRGVVVHKVSTVCGASPLINRESADCLLSTVGPIREAVDWHDAVDLRAGAHGILVCSVADAVTSFQVISIDLYLCGFTVVGVKSVRLQTDVIVPPSRLNLVGVLLYAVDPSAERGGPRGRLLCQHASRQRYEYSKNSPLHCAEMGFEWN